MGPVSWGSWIVSHQLGCPQAGPLWVGRQVSMSGPNKAGTGVCLASRVLEEPLTVIFIFQTRTLRCSRMKGVDFAL